MGTRSKDSIKAMIVKDFLDAYNRYMEVKRSLNDNLEETLDYFNALIGQIPQSTVGPLIAKTPKVLRKRGVQRIETIPENDVVSIDNTVSDSMMMLDKTEVQEVKTEPLEDTRMSRSKRQASMKAANNIKQQQTLSLTTKLRRPSEFSENNDIKKNRNSRTKRKKSGKSSSDEETTQGPSKLSKMEDNVLRESAAKQMRESAAKQTRESAGKQTRESAAKQTRERSAKQTRESSAKQAGESGTKRSRDSALKQTVDRNSQNQMETENQEVMDDTLKKSPMVTRTSTRKRTFSQSHNMSRKKSNGIDDTVLAPKGNDVEEPSMYEDAIGKPVPIMNSTMNFNSTFVMHKLMNATVVLEPLSAIKLNETVTINKLSGNNIEKNAKQRSIELKAECKSPSSKSLQNRKQQLKDAMANKEFDDLLTDDESSPEVKKLKQTKKQGTLRRQKRVTRSATSSEDEVLNTPVKPTLKEVNKVTGFQDIKNAYKSNALFSPYAKESVKKRVEAFEQAGMNSPKATVDIDVPTRVTRTKTRAIAAAQAEASENTLKASDKTVAHKLARKSLAKAKKISLAKHAKDMDEYKENKVQSAQKLNKATLEKLTYKQQQKTTTPLGKMKTQLPMSVNRIHHTPSNQINTNHYKASTVVRTNIVTSMDSFIQPTKPASKRNSVDKIEEKKRKLNDEDARKKREDALKLQTEEKRRKRQEKELKNKLAREAKEKQDMEKRQKAEKEREEKARLAQQMQEKQREEMDRKRLAQLQRAQEKEERRRLEEQQRLQRLQEQEEAERLLAEQRRREQEAERRKEAESRAQQQAAAEAMRTKHHMLLAQAKCGSKNHGPTNYILDSEPDDDESDDESRPKHAVPHWAQPQIRRIQLAMQRYIPERGIYKFFDSKKCTPDLTELFQGIDRNKLKRTSSAIWKTPPRFSMMEIE